MRSVAAYADGSSFENFLICGPVKRSKARDPVFRASNSAPPTASVISAHSRDVLESSQIGATGRDSAGAICSPIGRRGSNRANVDGAPALQYTLPCCCADPEIAVSRLRSRPLEIGRAHV